MASRQEATALLGRMAAVRSIPRYRDSKYACALECFTTTDPKAKTGTKLEKPWPNHKSYEDVWKLIDSGALDILYHQKTKQTFWTNSAAGYSTASMLLSPGSHIVAQGQRDETSWEILGRVCYILRHMKGPFTGQLKEGEDWEASGNEVVVRTFLGEPCESRFTAIPSGAAKWRVFGVTLGILDEAAYHREQKATIEAALSACEGGGFLWIFSTGVFGSQFNEEMDRKVHEYRVWAIQNQEEYVNLVRYRGDAYRIPGLMVAA